MNRSRSVVLGLVAAALLFCPNLAQANMGTPLMWAGFLHLTVGNAIIGLGEGALVAWIFRTGVQRTAVVMIAANYFSAIVGMFAIEWNRKHLNPVLLGDTPLYEAPKLIWEMGIASYLTTIVLEWPFCLFAVGRKENRWKRSVLATLLAQTASYALLVPFYLSASGLTLYTKTVLDSTLSFAANRSAWIYFISIKDGDVYRIHPDASGKSKVLDTKFTNADTRLVAFRTNEGHDWDLWQIEGRVNETKRKLLLTSFAATAADLDTNFLSGTYFEMDFGRSADFRPETQRIWKAHAGHWPIEGLRLWNLRTGERFGIALETPFIMDWSARNVTSLPGDQVVYQLGEQIVLFDPSSRKLGLITKGRGPVVVFE